MVRPTRLQLTCCVVDLRAGRVERPGGEQPLTTLEQRLLVYLAERIDADVGRDELLREIWGYQRPVATRAVDSTVTRLRTKIEVDPAAPRHLITVWNAGYRLQVAEAAEEAPAPLAPPVPADRFFGRARELAALDAGRAEGRRLLTLRGPGGIGKTRLARQWMASVAARTLVCPVAAATDALDLARIVAAALPDGDVAQGLEARLRHLGDAVLLLDGVDALAAVVSDTSAWWLQRVPSLTVLVTSRQRLGLPGEVCIDVGPLDPESARALFVDRSLGAGTTLAADDPDVATLCARLEAHPLAIELGAALTDVFSARGLAERLVDSHAVLDGAGGAGLAEMFRGSWARLDAAEQGALRQLSVFRGGFSVESAEGTLGEGALALLRSLRAKSLVRMLPDSGGRLSVYEVLRVRVLADAAPQAVHAVTDAHRAWFLAQVRRRLPSLGALPDVGDLPWLRAEVENVAQALRATCDGDPEGAAALAIALYHVLVPSGHGEQAVAHLDAVLARGDALGPGARGELLRARVNTLRLTLAPRELYTDVRRAQEQARAAADDTLLGRTLALEAALMAQEGRLDEGVALLSAAATRLATDRAQLGRVLADLGRLLWDLGRMDEARDRLVEAERVLRAGGNLRAHALLASKLGQFEVEGGDPAGLPRIERALERLREAQDELNVAAALTCLAYALCHTGRHDEAIAAMDEAIVILRTNGDLEAEAGALVLRAAAWAGAGQREQALRDAELALHLGSPDPAVAAAAWGLTAILQHAQGLPAAVASARRAAHFSTSDARAAWVVVAAAAATGEPLARRPGGSPDRFAELNAVRALLPEGWAAEGG